MDNLTDVYNQFASIDDELEKQASEMVKQAEEEQFAGRIMARGFADEMNKLAGSPAYEKQRTTGSIGGIDSPSIAQRTKKVDFSKTEGSTVKPKEEKVLSGGDSVSFKPEKVKATKPMAFRPGASGEKSTFSNQNWGKIQGAGRDPRAGGRKPAEAAPAGTAPKRTRLPAPLVAGGAGPLR
jgi:hypothetical protein